MSETTTATKTTTNATVRGASRNWDGKVQNWRFVIHENGHFIEMHQHGKNFTLRLDTEQLQEIRKALNEVLE
tara:strand:+ start:69 stop:284 length:216 start_codon:yes stop_codon:yes gene_type:complete